MHELEQQLLELAEIKGIDIKTLLSEENIEPYDDDKDYQEWIDEIYPPYEIGSCKFYASRILSELDPTAYRCGYDDFIDGHCQDGYLIYLDSTHDYYVVEELEELINKETPNE